MNHMQKNHSSEHQEVTMLLPWYVNKTLHNDEHHLVESHLKNCLVCKIELTNLQKLSTSICLEDSLVPVAHASYVQLKNRIHKNQVPAKQKTGIFESLLAYRQWLANLTAKNLVPLFPCFALASLLLLTYTLLSPDFFATQQNPTNSFHTLSSSQRITHEQNEIRLVFANEITQQQIMQILATVQGQIIAGPTTQGVFRVRIGKTKISSKALLKTVSLLRDNKQVIFAEPTFALSSLNHKSPG